MIGSFAGLPLRVMFLASDRWVVTHPFTFLRPNGLEHTVPVLPRGADRLGFVTDGATIPRVFWSIIGGPEGAYFPAAVLHDFLYVAKPVDRYTADCVFLEAMKALGVNRAKRYAMFWAVRAAGWIVWNRRNPLDTVGLTAQNPGLHFVALPRETLE